MMILQKKKRKDLSLLLTCDLHFLLKLPNLISKWQLVLQNMMMLCSATTHANLSVFYRLTM